MKNETLADVLRHLEEFAPERFSIYGTHRNRIALKGLDSFDLRSLDDWQHGDRTSTLVLGACIKECEERGWPFMVRLDPDGFYVAEILSPDPKDPTVHMESDADGDSSAFAMATALRDALRNNA